MFTENYIKMCEKAEEIQKLKPKGIWHLHYDPEHQNDPDRLDNRDYLYNSFYYLPREDKMAILKWDNDEEHPIIGNYYDNTEGAIWLPTQEQLQEMVLVPKNTLIPDIFTMISFLNVFMAVNKYDDMNELWLAFVMKERWNKIWTGKNWELTK